MAPWATEAWVVVEWEVARRTGFPVKPRSGRGEMGIRMVCSVQWQRQSAIGARGSLENLRVHMFGDRYADPETSIIGRKGVSQEVPNSPSSRSGPSEMKYTSSPQSVQIPEKRAITCPSTFPNPHVFIPSMKPIIKY